MSEEDSSWKSLKVRGRITPDQRIELTIDRNQDPPKSFFSEPLKKILKGANSPFGIFLFTSVLLALLTQRHAEIQAAATRLAMESAEKARLMVELTRRSDELDAIASEMVSASGVVAACKKGGIMDIPLDRKNPTTVKAAADFQAVLGGTLPHATSSPSYANTHLLALMLQVDENFHDHMSRGDLTWSGERSAPGRTYGLGYAIRRWRMSSLCDYRRAADAVSAYQNAREYGICSKNPEGSGYFCRRDLGRYAGMTD